MMKIYRVMLYRCAIDVALTEAMRAAEDNEAKRIRQEQSEQDMGMCLLQARTDLTEEEYSSLITERNLSEEQAEAYIKKYEQVSA